MHHIFYDSMLIGTHGYIKVPCLFIYWDTLYLMISCLFLKFIGTPCILWCHVLLGHTCVMGHHTLYLMISCFWDILYLKISCLLGHPVPDECAARRAILFVECSMRWLFKNVITEFMILLKLPDNKIFFMVKLHHLHATYPLLNFWPTNFSTHCNIRLTTLLTNVQLAALKP